MLSVFSLIPDLLFDCSRVLEYAKIRTVLQSKKTRGRGKRKVFTRNFKGEHVESRCLVNERFRSSDEYCVKLERNERKEETEKYHSAFHSIVGFAGKYFLFSPPPPPHSSFSALPLQLSHNNSIGNALLAFVLYSRRLLRSLFGPLYVSGKLPTYPSPQPTLTLSSHLRQNVGLGEG